MTEQNVNQNVNVTQVAMASAQGCAGVGCFGWIAVAIVVSLAWHYWYVTLPVVAAIAFLIWKAHQDKQAAAAKAEAEATAARADAQNKEYWAKQGYDTTTW